MNPQRITIHRRTHYNLQEQSKDLNGLEAVNCSKQSKFGNPFTNVEEFKKLIEKNDSGKSFVSIKLRHFNTKNIQESLKGKNLGCWCLEGNKCHCDILLEVANATNNQ
jgi:hypothetical protein